MMEGKTFCSDARCDHRLAVCGCLDQLDPGAPSVGHRAANDPRPCVKLVEVRNETQVLDACVGRTRSGQGIGPASCNEQPRLRHSSPHQRHDPPNEAHHAFDVWFVGHQADEQYCGIRSQGRRGGRHPDGIRDCHDVAHSKRKKVPTITFRTHESSLRQCRAFPFGIQQRRDMDGVHQLSRPNRPLHGRPQTHPMLNVVQIEEHPRRMPCGLEHRTHRGQAMHEHQTCGSIELTVDLINYSVPPKREKGWLICRAAAALHVVVVESLRPAPSCHEDDLHGMAPIVRLDPVQAVPLFLPFLDDLIRHQPEYPNRPTIFRKRLQEQGKPLVDPLSVTASRDGQSRSDHQRVQFGISRFTLVDAQVRLARVTLLNCPTARNPFFEDRGNPTSHRIKGSAPIPRQGGCC